MEVQDILNSDFYNKLSDRDKIIYENYFTDVAKSPYRKLNKEEKEIFSFAVYKAVSMVPSFRDAIALLRPFVDVTCDTAYIDKFSRNGLSYWFFWYTKDVYERATILLHESMHVLYNHFSRSELAGITGMNMLYSSDLEINSVIKKIPRSDISHGISPYDFGFPEMKTMEIYSDLIQNLKETPKMKTQKAGKSAKDAFTFTPLTRLDMSASAAAEINITDANGLTLFDKLFIRQMNGGAIDPEEEAKQGQSGEPSSENGQNEDDESGDSSEGDSGDSSDSSSENGDSSSESGDSSGDSADSQSSSSGKSKSSSQSSGEESSNSKGSSSNGENSPQKGDNSPETDNSETDLSDEEVENANDTIKDISRRKEAKDEKSIVNSGECDESTEERSEAADDAGIEKVSAAEQSIAKKNTMQKIVEESQNRSAGSGAMDEFLKISIGLMSPPKADWRKIFKGIVASFYGQAMLGRNHTSMSRVNRRYSQGNMILPGTIDYIPEAMLGFDTSGSMGTKDYKAGLSEIEEILKSIMRGRNSLKVFPVDTQVKGIQCVNSIKDIDFSGGGGTDMSVAFKYVNELPAKKRPSIFILVTDGGTNWDSIANELMKARGYRSVILVTDSYMYKNVSPDVRRLATVIDISD